MPPVQLPQVGRRPDQRLLLLLLSPKGQGPPVGRSRSRPSATRRSSGQRPAPFGPAVATAESTLPETTPPPVPSAAPPETPAVPSHEIRPKTRPQGHGRSGGRFDPVGLSFITGSISAPVSPKRRILEGLPVPSAVRAQDAGCHTRSDDQPDHQARRARGSRICGERRLPIGEGG